MSSLVQHFKESGELNHLAVYARAEEGPRKIIRPVQGGMAHQTMMMMTSLLLESKSMSDSVFQNRKAAWDNVNLCACNNVNWEIHSAISA